jgi:hypothetical protein
VRLGVVEAALLPLGEREVVQRRGDAEVDGPVDALLDRESASRG